MIASQKEEVLRFVFAWNQVMRVDDWWLLHKKRKCWDLCLHEIRSWGLTTDDCIHKIIDDPTKCFKFLKDSLHGNTSFTIPKSDDESLNGFCFTSHITELSYLKVLIIWEILQTLHHKVWLILTDDVAQSSVRELWRVNWVNWHLTSKSNNRLWWWTTVSNTLEILTQFRWFWWRHSKWTIGRRKENCP